MTKVFGKFDSTDLNDWGSGAGFTKRLSIFVLLNCSITPKHTILIG